jgi:hypothetical protein
MSMKQIRHARPPLPLAAILACLALGVGCEDKEARKDFLEISFRVATPIKQIKELNSKGAVKQFTNKEPLMGVVDTMQICHEMGEPAKRIAAAKTEDLKTPAAKSLLASVKVNAQSLVEASEVCLLNAKDCAPKCDSALSDLTTSVAALSAAAKRHEVDIGSIR